MAAIAATARRLLIALALLSATQARAALDLRIVSESAAPANWKRAVPGVLPLYPPDVGGDTACINLGYRVNADGATSDFTILKAWSAQGGASSESRQRLGRFARSAAAAVSFWHFQPLGQSRRLRPAYTSSMFTFAPSPGSDSGTTAAHCAIADLPEFISRAQRAVSRRGSLMQARMDGKRQGDPAMIPYQKHDWFDGPIGP